MNKPTNKPKKIRKSLSIYEWEWLELELTAMEEGHESVSFLIRKALQMAGYLQSGAGSHGKDIEKQPTEA